MGMLGMISIFVLWALSWLIFDTSLSILPAWLVDNSSLYILTLIMWNVGFALGFIIFGLKRR